MQQRILATIKPLASKLCQSSTTWVLIIFFLVATAITFPFILHPRTTLTAPLASDTSSSVALYGAFVREGTNPFMVPRASSIAAPDGIKNNVGVNRASWLSTAYLWISSLLLGPIMAHSLEAFLGFTLTASVMFFFIRTVTRSAAVGLIAGLAYGFWPHMLSLGRAAPTYTHMWLFILPIWAFWILATEDMTRKRLLLAFGSILPAVFWTPYFTYHVSLVALACLGVAAWYIKDRFGWRKTGLLVAGFAGGWLLVFGVYYLLGMSSSHTEIPTRSLAEAYQQSSHGLMYLAPGQFSLWGQGLNDTLVKIVPRAAQTNLYVGVSLVIFALMGLVLTLRKTTFRTKRSRLEHDKLRPAVFMALSVILLCFVFSLPPSTTIAGVTIPLPNQLVAESVPALRAGQRLVMPLMGGMVILAAIGAHLVLQKYPGRRKYVILAIIIGIIGVDLWSPCPDSATRLVPSAAISRLENLPEGRVAQYQRESLVGYPGQTMCMAQLYHKKPIINDCGMGRSATAEAIPSPQLAATINKPLCAQPQRLKQLKVTYVVIANDDRRVLQCFQGQMPLDKDDQYHIFTLK